MRRQTPLAHILYNHLFPNPTTNDPPSFSAHLARSLVPEVRIEVQRFYGDLNSAEARYPGLNYSHPAHRMRLGKFPHHRRLFRAFDELGLTESEIQDFCCWEGTKWARERYEKDEGITVRDTTGREIGPYVDRREQRAAEEARRQSITRKTDISVIVEETAHTTPTSRNPPQLREEEEEEEADEEMSDADDSAPAQPPQPIPAQQQQQSQPTSHRHSTLINQQIIAAWQQGERLDPEIEQFLKEQSERGTLHADLDVVSNFHPRALRGYLRPAGSAAAAAAAATGAGSGAVVGSAGRAAA